MHTFRRDTTIISVSTLLMVALTLAWDARAEPAAGPTPAGLFQGDDAHDRH